MHGDMVGFVALNFVLRLIFSGVVRMPLIISILSMYFDNPAADMPSFGIPGDVIAHFKIMCHVILHK